MSQHDEQCQNTNDGLPTEGTETYDVTLRFTVNLDEPTLGRPFAGYCRQHREDAINTIVDLASMLLSVTSGGFATVTRVQDLDDELARLTSEPH